MQQPSRTYTNVITIVNRKGKASLPPTWVDMSRVHAIGYITGSLF
jgi:hypothetical protein